MDGLTVLEPAGNEFLTRLELVRPDQWGEPTVCDGWTVDALVSHVLNACTMTTALLNGVSGSEAAALMNAPLGAEVVEALRVALEDHATAFNQPGVLDRMLPHPSLEMLGVHLLGYRIIDLAVHAWDLARSLGLDEHLHPDVVEYMWEFLQPLAPVIAQIGIFGAGPSGTVSDDAPLQIRVLDLIGRRP